MEPNLVLIIILIALITLALMLSSARLSQAAVTEYDREADDWLMETPGSEGVAFDDDYEGAAGTSGCLLDPPETDPEILALVGGTVTVSAADNGVDPSCPISDSSSAHAASDGRLQDDTSKYVFEFSPPVDAFYTFYGSLASGEIRNVPQDPRPTISLSCHHRLTTSCWPR